MKKIIRAIIKIPATPFIVVGLLCGIIIFKIVQFFEWVYEADEFNKDTTKDIIKELVENLKKWFTTV